MQAKSCRRERSREKHCTDVYDDNSGNGGNNINKGEHKITDKDGCRSPVYNLFQDSK